MKTSKLLFANPPSKQPKSLNRFVFTVTMVTLFFLLLIGLTTVNAQNNVGIGTLTPDPSSLLDLSTTNKGVLVPRLTSLQRLAITTPANGLLVYDTNFDCFYYYSLSATNWVSLCASGSGSTGPTGPTGTAGTNGATGATGTSGTNGIDGATGASGSAGINGVDGATGATGTAGTNGIDGAIGATGTAGTNGTNGATGATGTAGTNGIDGATGATGTAGTNGTNGATGATGTAGINGINGTTGATGTTGANGTTVLGGVGTYQPLLIINNGGIQYKNLPNEGIVLVSAGGTCWKITVDNSGNIVTQSVVCP